MKKKRDQDKEKSMNDEEVSEELKPETQPTKRRKAAEKTVVRVRISVSSGKQKNEGPPSDSWSWRKYGQKPIKGSPYPRGYYRCSTSKGCSAKKQVERCRLDDSVLVITYTSSHNHPGPTVSTVRQNPTPKEEEEEGQEHSHQEEPAYRPDRDRDGFHYLDQAAGDLFSTMNHLYRETAIISADNIGEVLLDAEEPAPLPQEFPKTEELENDFFDELEELLPTISSLKTVEGIWFEERVPAVSS